MIFSTEGPNQKLDIPVRMACKSANRLSGRSKVPEFDLFFKTRGNKRSLAAFEVSTPVKKSYHTIVSACD